MRAASPQLSIPLPPQSRNICREAVSMYEAITILRRAGHRVHREGRFHAVNGARVTTTRLKRLARAVAP